MARGEHTAAVLETQNRMLEPLPARRRHLETRRGRRVHVVETGDTEEDGGGAPALFLHGTNTSSLGFVPFLGLVEGLRAIFS